MTNAPYLKQSDSGVWYVHWTVDRIGKRVSTKTKDHAAAAAFLADWLRSSGVAPAAEPRDTYYLPTIWSFYKLKHAKASEYAASLAWKNLASFFFGTRVCDLNQTLIDQYVDQRTRGQIGRTVLPQTAAKELTYLLAAIRYCADTRRGIIPAKHAVRYDLPAAGEPRDRWLKTSEIQALLAAAGRLRNGDRLSRAERFLWLALETAGRCQALLDLTWDRVDFETGMISLNVPGRKRTRKRRADVPMSKALRPIMERAYAERTGNVVLDHGGAIWADIQTVTIEAGLAPKQVVARGSKPKATGISPHVLRHTAATHMARRGVSLFHISKILGNSVQVVEKTYAKYAPGDLKKAVDLISNGELEAAE